MTTPSHNPSRRPSLAHSILVTVLETETIVHVPEIPRYPPATAQVQVPERALSLADLSSPVMPPPYSSSLVTAAHGNPASHVVSPALAPALTEGLPKPADADEHDHSQTEREHTSIPVALNPSLPSPPPPPAYSTVPRTTPERLFWLGFICLPLGPLIWITGALLIYARPERRAQQDLSNRPGSGRNDDGDDPNELPTWSSPSVRTLGTERVGSSTLTSSMNSPWSSVFLAVPSVKQGDRDPRMEAKTLWRREERRWAWRCLCAALGFVMLACVFAIVVKGVVEGL